jgi:hypothetical protein
MPQEAVGSFFHTPGPKELYVAFRANQLTSGYQPFQFLGTCVTAPDISEFPKVIDVYNDYGGRSVPTQLIWDGSESRVACTINLIDLAVCRNLRDQSERSGLPSKVGRETNLDRGALMIGKSDFQFMFKNTYYGTVNGTDGMVQGRRYFSVILEGYEEHTTGTRVEEVSLLLRCNNVFLGSGGFAQYTEDANEVLVVT